MPSRSTTREQDNQMIELYKEGESTSDIADRFDVSSKLVRSRIRERDGVKLRQKGYMDVYAFDDLDSDPEARYWAGFIMADGSIVEHEGGYQDTIDIGLSRVDREHLQKFLDFVSAVRCSITDRETEEGEYSQITITSDRISNRLRECGVVPRKTGIEEAKGSIKFSSHFWRGVIDGDGAIELKSRSDSDGEYWRLRLSGSLPLVGQFKNYLQDEVGINSSAQITENKRAVEGGFAYQITGYQDVLDSLIDLYQDTPVALDRKQQKAKEAIEFLNDQT